MMKKPGNKEVYTTIIILALAAFAIHFWFHVQYAEYVGVAFLVIALVFYSLARWITIGWLKFAELIGSINSRILLSVIFFIFLFPIAMLYRLMGKSSFRKNKLTDSQASYFHQRNHTYEPNDFKQTF